MRLRLYTLILMLAFHNAASAAEAIQGSSVAMEGDSVVLKVPDEVPDSALTAILHDGKLMPTDGYQLSSRLLVIKKVKAGEYRIVILHKDGQLTKIVSVRQLDAGLSELAPAPVIRAAITDSSATEPEEKDAASDLKKQIRDVLNEHKARETFSKFQQRVTKQLGNIIDDSPFDATTAITVIKTAAKRELGEDAANSKSFKELVAQLGDKGPNFKILVDELRAFKPPSPPAAQLPAVTADQDSKPKGDQQANSPFEEEEVIELVVKTLDKDFKLYKVDSDYGKTIRAIIVALQDLRNGIDVAAISLSEYQAKTKAAVVGVVRKLEDKSGRETWLLAYSAFNERVKASKTLGVGEPKVWDKAVVLLISGLQRAADLDDDWVKELARNQTQPFGSQPGATSRTYAGGGTWHSVHMARKARRILDRAAVNHAKIQRIRGY